MLKSAARKIYHKILPYETRVKLFAARQAIAERPKTPSGVRCKVCDGTIVEPFTNPVVARLSFDFYRCRDCGFIFIYPPPDDATLSAFYGHGAVIEMGADEPLWNGQFLDAIEKYAGKRGRILEIGFGDAGFLKLAHERGWEVHGAELSEPCARHATDDLQLPNIRRGTLAEIGYAEDYFDAVAAFNFIEHVPDLRGTLAELKRMLRPGGLLVLLCPNLSGIYHQLVPELFGDKDPLNISWVPPAHLSYFDKNNFQRLLESTGFKVLGDESARTNLLWLQHEVSIGPRATDERLAALLSEIKSSKTSAGEARTEEYRLRIAELLSQRLAWTFVSDVIELEAALGAENAVLFIAEKLSTHSTQHHDAHPE